jgi:hypothetical protein
VTLSPPIQISFTASTGANTQGQFMIMQIIDTSYSQYTDSRKQSWYLTNGPAFPGFNGPLHDDSATYNSIGYPFLIGGTWNGPNSVQPTPTGPTTPAGAAAVPTWVNVGAAYAATPFKMGS